MDRTGPSEPAFDVLARDLKDADSDVRMRAVVALGESGDPRAARQLVPVLRDDHVAVSVAAVKAFEQLRDPVGVLPMYELVQDEQVDTSARRAAAETLVKLGLLRRKRVGPSRPFLWLLGLTLVVVAAAAGETIGTAGAIALFVAGAAGLVVYSRRAVSSERASGTYVGPHGDTIQF